MKGKILDDFKKVLLEEAKKNEEDYASKLYKLEKRLVTVKSLELRLYHTLSLSWCMMSAFQRYQKKKFERKPEYALTALWCNYQRQYEFNPPHDHDGKLSFVIYLSIPDPLKKKIKKKNYF